MTPQPTRPDTGSLDTSDDYERDIALAVPIEQVFDALTTRDGLAGWWTPLVTGTPTSGGEVRFGFAGLDEEIVMRVDEASHPTTVIWTCLTHTGHPEWVGTTIQFGLERTPAGTGVLRFRHIGLIPQLSCYETCESGWEHFLASLLEYSERGTGRPFRAA